MAEITVPLPDELILSRLTHSRPTQVNRSVWTGRRKVIGLAGTETWSGQVSIGMIATEEEERQWRAFLFSLIGPENWFRWPLPCNRHIGPKPTVASGAGADYTLPLTGMQPSARIARAGQFLTVPLPSGHNRAVCLAADLRADASGNATAAFSQALGEVPATGATVESAYPFIPMAPVDSSLSIEMGEGVSGAGFAVEEAL